MDRLRNIHTQLLENAPDSIRRYLLDEIEWDKRLIAISGARGTEKTTLLLQHIKENYGSGDPQALYITLDDIRTVHFPRSIQKIFQTFFCNT